MMLTHDPHQCVEKIINLVGPKIVLATPLGIGKPIQFLNALYERVKNDSSLNLTILTALTLSKPKIKNNLAKRLLDPFFERVYGDYEDLIYELDRRAQILPNNIRVIEFFFTQGAYLNNPRAQQDFVYTNYTYAVRDAASYGINLIAMMAAEDSSHPEALSLSSNADLTLDLIKAFPKAHVVAQISSQLPYMFGEQAEIDTKKLSIILKNKNINKKLFSVPRMPINYQDHAIGLHASSLIQDDGCLQIGIGSLSDAIIYALILRHKSNKIYNKILSKLANTSLSIAPFTRGLSGLTEMLVDGYLQLYDAGILVRKFSDEENIITHAGFFLGSNGFYKRLADMPVEERKLFSMRSISEINQLYGNESKRRLERKNACFVNFCMKASIFGEVISDTLSNGLTVSGVGGQYNFVAMANELENAKSIIICKSYYYKNGRTVSNIFFNDGPSTISRHLRDIIITEYGIAYLRGKTDEEVIKAMLNITDSRFQNKLLKQAKKTGKIDKNYQIPKEYSNNFPDTINKFFKEYEHDALFPDFPLGSEFKEEEIYLLKALEKINNAPIYEKISLACRGLIRTLSGQDKIMLERMNLTSSTSLKSILYRSLILGSMK